MTRDEYNDLYGIAVSQNDTAFDHLPGPIEIGLRRIDISENKKNQRCQHDEIRDDITYLVHNFNSWHVGHFVKVWYGWNFHGGLTSFQLNSLNMVFETDLPKISKWLVEEPKKPKEGFSDEEDEENEDLGW